MGLIEHNCDLSIKTGDVDTAAADEISSYLIAGDWTFSFVRTGELLKRISKTINPGLNPYTFDWTPTPPATFPEACAFKGAIVGIQIGDRFRFGGPCVVDANVLEEYPLYLIMPTASGDVVEEFPLFGEILSNGSELYVRKESAPGVFTPHRFNIGGDALITTGAFGHGLSGPGEFDDPSQFNPVALMFLDPGLYEVELVWYMPKPPTFVGKEKISSEIKLIDVQVNRTPLQVVPEEAREVTYTINPKIDAHLNRLAFLVERRKGSGGHDREHHTPSLPETPEWEVMDGTQDNTNTHPTGTVESPLIVSRQSTGTKKYQASKFGGLERARIFGVPPSFPSVSTQKDLKDELDRQKGQVCQLGSVEIEVKVPDLELLPDAPDPDDYEKIGGTPEHLGPPSSTTDNNHWGKPSVIQALKDIAAAYDLIPFLGPIKYNDISLPWGGGFDVDGNWGADLAASNHSGHRIGKAADVRSDPPNSDGISLSGPLAWSLKGIVSYYGGEAKDHGNHWHLKF